MYSGLRIKKVQMSSKTSSLSKDFVTSPIWLLGEISEWTFFQKCFTTYALFSKSSSL